MTQRTVTDNDGHSYTWHYQWMMNPSNVLSVNGTYTNIVTDPLGNDSVHVFTDLGGASHFFETNGLYYKGPSISLAADARSQKLASGVHEPKISTASVAVSELSPKGP